MELAFLALRIAFSLNVDTGIGNWALGIYEFQSFAY